MTKQNDEARDEVLRLVKEVHATGGRTLPRDEVLELITRPIYMGRPRVPAKPAGQRGPTPRKDQSRLAHERRRDLWRRLVALPELGRASGWLARTEYMDTLTDVAFDAQVTDRRRVSEVLRRLARSSGAAPDARTVRRHLGAIRKLTESK